jgi:hypothetical protein
MPLATITASLVTSTHQFRAAIVRQCFRTVSAWFFLSLLVDPEGARQYVHPKRRWNSTGLHAVISKKGDYFVFRNHYEFGCEHPGCASWLRYLQKPVSNDNIGKCLVALQPCRNTPKPTASYSYTSFEVWD